MHLDPTITTAITGTLETAINSALEYDPGTQHQLTSLEGALLEIKSTQPEFSVFLTSSEKKLKIFAHSAIDADALISGHLKDIVTLFRKPNHTLADTGVSATGKLQLISDYRALINNLDIDWEAIINKFTGDIVGHQISNGLRSVFSWGNSNLQKFPHYFSEFIQEELNLIPTEAELKYFAEQVDDLRAATDRVQARFTNLKK